MLNVLFDDQHGIAFLTDPADQSKDLLHHHRRQTGRWLIHQQQLRARHDRATDRTHLLLTTGHGACKLSAALLHPGKQLVDKTQALGGFAARRRGERAKLKVVLHAHARKQTAVFRHVGHTAFDNLVRRYLGKRLPLHSERTRERSRHTRDHPHQRGFASTIRADHGHRLSGLHLERYIEQRLERTVTGVDALQFKHGHSCS